MTDGELAAIEARMTHYRERGVRVPQLSHDEAFALVAEVRRLRGEVSAERGAIAAFVDQEGDPILAEMIRKGVHHSGQPSTAETETSVNADAYIAALQRHLGPYEQVTVGTGGFCYPCDRCRKTWLGFADSDSAEVFALDHGATCAGQK